MDRIKAPVTYLPEDPSAADADISAWFKANLPRFLNDHMHVLARRPLAYISTFLQMIHYSFKYRKGFFKKIKKVFFKDFLRAGYIACQVLRSGQFAHLHGHFCHGSTTITMFVSRLTGIPFSFTAHAKDIYLPKLNPKDLLKVKIRKAEFVATCTDANRVHLQKICPEAANIQTIYHGLDTSLFRPIDQPGHNHKIPLILAVGRCVAKKGFPYLVQACGILQEKGYTFKCQIIGETGEHTLLIKQLIRTLKLDTVISLCDYVTQEELRQIYENSTVFVLPCQIIDNGDRDGIPNVLVEAMAMGIPAVSTAISGIPELIENNVDGLLVPEKDAEALAGALEALLRDPFLRSELAKNAREKVCRLFDSKKTTTVLGNLLESCISTNRRIAA